MAILTDGSALIEMVKAGLSNLLMRKFSRTETALTAASAIEWTDMTAEVMAAKEKQGDGNTCPHSLSAPGDAIAVPITFLQSGIISAIGVPPQTDLVRGSTSLHNLSRICAFADELDLFVNVAVIRSNWFTTRLDGRNGYPIKLFIAKHGTGEGAQYNGLIVTFEDNEFYATLRGCSDRPGDGLYLLALESLLGEVAKNIAYGL
jgi:hypothetical protein